MDNGISIAALGGDWLCRQFSDRTRGKEGVILVLAHFTEDELEQTAIGWLQELGYDYRFGPDIAPDGASPERGHYGDVILENRLRSTLATLNPDLPVTAIEEAIQKLKRVEHPDLLANNRDFHNYVRGGIPVTVKASHGDRTL